MTRLAVLLALAACGGGQRAGAVSRDDAVIKLTSNVADAEVYVDGRFIAPLGAIGAGIAVEPGTHRFELRHEDYFSSYLELELARAERKQVAIDLAPVLP